MSSRYLQVHTAGLCLLVAMGVDVRPVAGQCQVSTNADVIVRLTGDCPLMTPDTVDEVVTAFLAADVDYATNTYPYTRPDGLDVEVFTRGALELARRQAAPGPDRARRHGHHHPPIRHASGLDLRGRRLVGPPSGGRTGPEAPRAGAARHRAGSPESA